MRFPWKIMTGLKSFALVDYERSVVGVSVNVTSQPYETATSVVVVIRTPTLWCFIRCTHLRKVQPVGGATPIVIDSFFVIFKKKVLYILFMHFQVVDVNAYEIYSKIKNRNISAANTNLFSRERSLVCVELTNLLIFSV